MKSQTHFRELKQNRWLASGKTILNNKGLPVMQYEPWFSINSDYEFDERLSIYGVTPVMHYDPLGRLIQTDFPDEITTKVEFNAWEQQNYDQNDCDEDSPNFNTPQHIFVNPLGVVFKTIDDNRVNDEEEKTNENQIVTTQTVDILGQVVEVEDALGRNMTQNLYDMTGQIIAIKNIDSGLRQIICNAAQLPVYKWDNRQQKIRNSYDALLRPKQVFLQKESYPEILVQKIEYGTNALKNNINQIEHIFAQDGKTIFDLYDFKGNLITLKKQFAQIYDIALDYNNAVSMQAEIFETETCFNALNLPVTANQPDGTVVTNVYDKGGLLKQVLYNSEEYVSNIRYNARGQRKNIYYGNNSKIKYVYNPLNFRLKRLLTTRNGGQDILQDLNYEYDAVGNITEIRDDAQQTLYFRNQVIAPTGTYTYDALYRLITATGRELTNLGMPLSNDFPNNIPCPNLADNAMQNYTHYYQYDKLGNMQQVRSLGRWTRDYVYTEPMNNNYLLGHGGRVVYEYDEHGNMLRMPHLSALNWDYLDQMQSATNGTFTSYYNYDAEGNRTRKVVISSGIIETRYYMNGFEIYRRENSSNDFERKSLSIADDEKVFVRTEAKKIGQIEESPVARYQYDNYLGSACLELNWEGQIISYEEYHPFGTTSYRSGRSETEVSLKRYKYCGKERDEETGLYYYGMRYYAAWLCRFVSVDPLQFEYPHYTPYQYAGNKPISFIDLDGAEEFDPQNDVLYGPYILEPVDVEPPSGSWFANELTGEVFYSSEYREGDEGKGNMTGEGWVWLGASDMFGEVNNDFLIENQEFFNSNEDNYAFTWGKNAYYGEDGTGYEINFGENSEAFMREMGYNKKPLLVDVRVTTITQTFPDAGFDTITITNTYESIEKTYSSTYVKRGVEGSFNLIENYKISTHKIIGAATTKENRFEKRQYDYTKSNKTTISPNALNSILKIAADIMKIFLK